MNLGNFVIYMKLKESMDLQEARFLYILRGDRYMQLLGFIFNYARKIIIIILIIKIITIISRISLYI